jgi:ATP-dependent protease Clp ATPase subunit
MNFLIEPEALRFMAGVSVETGMMARGLRLIVGALVEELVFSCRVSL